MAAGYIAVAVVVMICIASIYVVIRRHKHIRDTHAHIMNFAKPFFAPSTEMPEKAVDYELFREKVRAKFGVTDTHTHKKTKSKNEKDEGTDNESTDEDYEESDEENEQDVDWAKNLPLPIRRALWGALVQRTALLLPMLREIESTYLSKRVLFTRKLISETEFGDVFDAYQNTYLKETRFMHSEAKTLMSNEKAGQELIRQALQYELLKDEEAKIVNHSDDIKKK